MAAHGGLSRGAVAPAGRDGSRASTARAWRCAVARGGLGRDAVAQAGRGDARQRRQGMPTRSGSEKGGNLEEGAVMASTEQWRRAAALARTVDRAHGSPWQLWLARDCGGPFVARISIFLKKFAKIFGECLLHTRQTLYRVRVLDRKHSTKSLCR